MKIALTYSTKAGLEKEYDKHFGSDDSGMEIPSDFFAEGDNPQTINAITESLNKNNHQVFGLEADSSVELSLSEMRPDLVFNIAEGLWGDLRESYVPFICERLGIPYTGSDPLTLAICLNKSFTKKMLYYHQIPTADFITISNKVYQKIPPDFFPAILKPVAEGSSKGIFNHSVIHSANEMPEKLEKMFAAYNQDILIEKFLTGREFTVAIWGNDEDIEVLPIVEINYSQLPQGALPIYSYEAKWIWDTTEKPLEIFQCPADITPQLENKIKEITINTYRALKIKDWCRIDVRLDENRTVNIIELNPLPGILPDPMENSCFPKAARAAGYNYDQMINNIIQIAAKRYGLNHA